jgi:LPS-assembly lipoprotein
MSWRNLIFVAATSLALAACGFKPLYGEQSTTAGASGPLAVEVALIPNREGQVMRSVLRRRFSGTAFANYRLDVALAQASAVTAIDAAGDATRRRVTMTAGWRLSPLAPDAPKPLDGRVRVVEAYNLLASDYANYTAESAARERAAARLADLVAQAATARATAAGWR